MKIALLFVSVFFTVCSVAKNPIHKGYYLFDRYKAPYPGAYRISTEKFETDSKFEMGIYEDAKFTKRVGKIWFLGEQSSVKGAARGGVIYKNKQYCEYRKISSKDGRYTRSVFLADMGSKSMNPKTGFSCTFLRYSIRGYASQDDFDGNFEAVEVTKDYFKLQTDSGDFFYLKRSRLTTKSISMTVYKPYVFEPFSSDYKEETKTLFENLAIAMKKNMSIEEFYKKYKVQLVYRRGFHFEKPKVTIVKDLREIPRVQSGVFKNKETFIKLRNAIKQYLQEVFTVYYPPKDFYTNSPNIEPSKKETAYQFNFYAQQLKKDSFSSDFNIYEKGTPERGISRLFNFIRFNVNKGKNNNYSLGTIVIEVLIVDEISDEIDYERSSWFQDKLPHY